jgi:transcriptional regulator with XRE-family HTH domain
MEFTGSDLRDVRKKHHLSRKELADYLEVSPVTIEKWEQHGKKIIRSKYYQRLSQLTGIGATGVAIGLLAAPALIPPALIAGGMAGIGALFTDEDLAKASRLLEGLKKLTPEERMMLWTISKKMQSNEEN